MTVLHSRMDRNQDDEPECIALSELGDDADELEDLRVEQRPEVVEQL